MKKEIVLLFLVGYNEQLLTSLSENLTYIFQNDINISCCGPREVESGDILNGDVFLQVFPGEIVNLESVVTNLGNVMPITRAVRLEALPQLQAIPKGSSVLVVNSTYAFSVETANNLFELGLGGITWIPFDPEQPLSRRYEGIDIAVTPNEAALVPPHIRNVIDVGDRCIDTYTMIRIATKLGLDSDEVNSRILQYSQSLLEPESSITKQYLDNFLKGAMFRYYAQNMQEGFLLCNLAGRLLYINEMAGLAFQRELSPKKDVYLNELMPREIDGIMQDNFVSDVLEIHGCSYSVRKTEVIVHGIKIGFSLTLQDELTIRENESTLAQNLAKRGLQAQAVFPDIVSSAPAMAKCITLARRAAATDYAVLIEGETGTGKELVAQAIHNDSQRKRNPFVAINCAAMPESLLESELFGYEGGAFTGALRQGKVGLFEQASGGTLFLDEIGDMPPALQALLLRVLQQKQILRIGGSSFINVDVRIIAASNKRLYDEVAKGRFREDLFYRLNVLPLSIPPLRQREGDIPILLQYYLGPDYASLSRQQKEYLVKQAWPGNVRQLQNFCNYFRTTHQLGGFFPSDRPDNEETAPDLLAWIKTHTKPGHGIGRAALIELYRENNIRVSDAWLRQELARLGQAGYITIGRGRQGCSITERGRQFLAQGER